MQGGVHVDATHFETRGVVGAVDELPIQLWHDADSETHLMGWEGEICCGWIVRLLRLLLLVVLLVQLLCMVGVWRMRVLRKRLLALRWWDVEVW